MNILIKNIDVITAGEGIGYIKNASIGISNSYIEFVDPEGSSREFKYDRLIDGCRHLAMPGFVNTHTHCAMTLLRNFANDLSLEDWLFNKVFPAEATLQPEDIYWGTMMGIAEMIKSGTTTFADMYLFMEEAAKAVCESGIRANLSRSPIKFVSDDETRYIDEMEKCIQFYKDWQGKDNDRIKVYLEVHSAYLFDRQSLSDAAQLAKQLNTGIHIHILETLTERRDSIKKYGMSSAEVCAECGIFDVPVIAAHCVHLSEEDIDILKEKRVNIAHNPTSNLKLGSGVARIPHLIDTGLNVALGTDGAASNNNLNMIEEMHIAALLHKGVNMDPQVVNAVQAVKMATVNGAEATGFGGSVGKIKKGMKADLVMLDMDQPHLTPLNDPFSAVVYSAQASDVDTVIVDGKILMEGKHLTTIDEELVKHKVREISQRVLKNT